MSSHHHAWAQTTRSKVLPFGSQSSK
jgi:hypothetical protein